MKTERQQDQDVAERLRRENLERASAPNDNEVDEKVMPDGAARAPVGLSWIQQRELIRAALCKELDADIEDSEPTYTIAMRAANALHWRRKELEDWRAKANDSAVTVAALEAEVERLRDINSSLVDKCNRLNLCGAQSDQRADAAERRVGELTSLLSDTVGNLHRMGNNEFADCDQERLDIVISRIERTLTGADPT